MNKRLFGQYFTITNPFETVGFYKWMEEIPNYESKTILEPFAGANNIPRMLIDDDVLPNSKWKCFDIEPSINKCPEFKITKQDTLQNYPKGFEIAITNPPYLSKNSATRRGLSYPETEYDDLYKLCLDTMLRETKYVAAIIPETFITSGLFHTRLHSVVSLTCKMFDDTECPVCLAMFSEESDDDFKLYRMNDYLGTYKELSKYDVSSSFKHDWKINDPDGEIGIWCVDSNKSPTIHFGDGKDIDSTKIKISSRSLTRVSGLPKEINLNLFIKTCNIILNEYRLSTKDVFMASFKGLRQDGLYRRRLDFATAKQIMNKALETLGGGESNE